MDPVDLAHDDVGDGPVVVLVHGHPFNRGMWAPQLAALRDRFRVIAPDLRGYGDSRSEEHTSELQSRLHLVCRLLLEKKKKNEGTAARQMYAFNTPTHGT